MTRSEAEDWLNDDRVWRINAGRRERGLMPMDRTTMAIMISHMPDEALEDFVEGYE